MDLYSAARRLSRPFRFLEDHDPADLPIGAHGVIGDGFSCALVRADGAIDWLCLPRFDSPSVFASILDRQAGGVTSVTPVARPFESLQRYDPDTNVLETLFQVPDQGVVRLTDYMPWCDDPRLSIHEVHRRIECREGEVDLEIIFDPRFDYGRDAPHFMSNEFGVMARSSSGDSLAAVVSGVAQWEERAQGGVRAGVKLRSGEGRWMVLSWEAERPEAIAAYRPYEHLRMTRHRWREWARGLEYNGPWRHHVLRSALVLKLLMYAPTGAMVAAPTTSLPEWIGGRRNWDYRYSWTRDSAMAIRATNLIGYDDEARDFFHFVRDTLQEAQSLSVMYGIDGSPVPEERELVHFRGFRDSSPVRIGNGARDQLQFDTIGALIDAAYAYERCGGSISLRAWRHLRHVVDGVSRTWQIPDHGIWEPRSDPRHNVHSKLMSWLALHRGSELAPLFGDDRRHERWKSEADRIHHDLCRNGLDRGGKHFVTAYELDRPDASLLLIPVHGFLSPEDPRVLSTIDWLRSELGAGPFIHRYQMDDGVGGPEGAFVLCGFWLSEALALAGRVDEAQEVFAAHADAANHLGLLAEEVDPSSGELLGNFPQAFSHLGLINAAARIDLALQLQDEGLQKHPEFTMKRR